MADYFTTRKFKSMKDAKLYQLRIKQTYGYSPEMFKEKKNQKTKFVVIRPKKLQRLNRATTSNPFKEDFRL